MISGKKYSYVLDAIMSEALVSSIIPIYAPTEVSFSKVINSFPNAGKIFLIACGNIIYPITCLYFKPNEYPASD